MDESISGLLRPVGPRNDKAGMSFKDIMIKFPKNIFLFLFCFVLASCSSGNDIFPDIPLSTNTADLDFPNPISIATDAANNQVILVNSKVDFFYDKGSIAVISVDVTDPTAPILAATDIIAAPNFAGDIVFDGTQAYVPFREASSTSGDQVLRYTIGAGSITNDVESTTQSNPFGIALNGTDVLVVCDKKLDILDADLNNVATVDLTTANSFDNTNSRNAEGVAVDTTNNRAYITNRTGEIFVVDLTSNTLTHVIDGPLTTRGIAFDGTYIYAVNGNSPAVWVLNPALLPAATSSPQEVDDATLVFKVISVGDGPNEIALDTTNQRAYVTNASDRNVSVIDLTALQEITRVSLKKKDTGFTEGKSPFGIAVDTFGGTPLVFVTNFESNTIEVINGTTLNVVASFPE